MVSMNRYNNIKHVSPVQERVINAPGTTVINKSGLFIRADLWLGTTPGDVATMRIYDVAGNLITYPFFPFSGWQSFYERMAIPFSRIEIDETVIDNVRLYIMYTPEE